MFIFGAWCVVFWAACHALGRSDRKALRYRACLSNIARLERELFPEQYATDKTEWREYVPLVQIQRNPYSLSPKGIPGKVGPG